VLLAKALRSSTFRLALIFIAIFGAAMFVLFGYVYWSTASYVRARSDAAIAAEQASLRRLYDREGRAGLAAAIKDRIGNDPLQRGVYALANPSFTPKLRMRQFLTYKLDSSLCRDVVRSR
jgi:hypothetical protein